jgi:hypothetical protein
MRKLLTILFMLLLNQSTRAQYSPYDEVSYDLLITEQWEELLEVSEKAICEGYTHDYLYMRAGYASFQLQRYMKSATYYEKALAFCKDTAMKDAIRYYLYWNYVYIGDYVYAINEYEIIIQDSKNKNIAPAPKLLHLANAEFGIKLSSDEALYKTLYYSQVGLGFRVFNKATGFVSASHLNQEAYYGRLNQQQIYVTGNIPFRRQWSIMPSFHFISYNHSNMQNGLSENDFRANPILAGLAVSKRLDNWRTSLSIAFSNFNKTTQWQQQVGINYYPFFNNKLETGIQLTHLYNNNISYLLYGAQLRYWALKRLSISCNYLLANTNNFNEQNGWLATNAFDKTDYRVQAGIEYMLLNNLSLYGLWQYEKRVESISKTNYSLQMALIGIKLIR